MLPLTYNSFSVRSMYLSKTNENFQIIILTAVSIEELDLAVLDVIGAQPLLSISIFGSLVD